MSEQPQSPSPSYPRPSDAAIIKALQEELNQVNSSRIFLIASISDLQEQAQAEIDRLNRVLVGALSLIADDDNRDKVFAFVTGVDQESSDDQDPGEPTG